MSRAGGARAAAPQPVADTPVRSWSTPAPLHPAAETRLVRMRDGVRLATDVYLPRPLRSRLPAVLLRVCNDKSGEAVDAARVAAQLGERGYALVVQDVRGTFRSGGELTPWLHEAEDGFDTIDWIVRQSWCDERVAMLGDAYHGFTQWAAVSTAHPGLRAVAPRVASQRVPDAWFAPDVASPYGVEWLARWWSGSGMVDPGKLDWRTRPFVDVVPADLSNARRLHREFLSLNEAELHAAIYPGRMPATTLGIPALHTGAWFDAFGSYTLRDWAIVSSRSPAAGHQYLVVPAEDHAGTPAVCGTKSPAAARAAAAERHVEHVLDFFDRHVRGIEPGNALPRVRYEIAHGDWRTADRWPPPDAQERRYYLTASGRGPRNRQGRLTDAPGTAAELTWVHDPENPVPSLIRVDAAMFDEPLPDESVLHARDDVLSFTGPVLEEPLVLVGAAAVDVVVNSSAPTMHLIATLTDVDPSGSATFIAEGGARIDTRYATASATLHIDATAYRLDTGHRLRLALACSRHPRYLVHPGTNDNVWTAVEARPAGQRLTVGGSGGSRLRISTLPP